MLIEVDLEGDVRFVELHDEGLAPVYKGPH